MQIAHDRPGGDLRYIRACTARGFVVGDEHHAGSLVVSASAVRRWSCDFSHDPPVWSEADLLDLDGELLIVGTGERLRFLPHRIHAALLERFAGVEVMTTEAACRTYDVTVLEGRRVVAAVACPGHGLRPPHGG